MDLRLLLTQSVSLDSALHNYTVSLCMWCVCGFITRIFLAVLATLGNISIDESPIMQGDRATFTCDFVKRDNDVSVIWEVDNEQYACPPEEGGEEGYKCTIDDSQSVLQLMNTNSLEVDNHTVQCILEQNIPEEYRNDSSFNEEWNNITRSAILTVNARPPTSISGEKVCVM